MNERLSTVVSMAKELMDKHGLEEWSFEFDRAKVRAGSCHWSRRRITMAREFALNAPMEEIKDTILHEIAHALTPGWGHGQKWKETARAIGCTAQRCHSIHFSKALYNVSCKNCGWKVQRNRQAKRQICRTCGKPPTYTINI